MMKWMGRKEDNERGPKLEWPQGPVRVQGLGPIGQSPFIDQGDLVLISALTRALPIDPDQ